MMSTVGAAQDFFFAVLTLRASLRKRKVIAPLKSCPDYFSRGTNVGSILNHRQTEDSRMASREPVVYATAFNEYALVKTIGSGGSGTVFEALDTEGKHFALKVIDPAKASTQKLKRFQNEIAFCQKTAHRNIITVLDHGRGPNKEPFYVMPLYEMTLEKAILQTIPAGNVLTVFGQLLDGAEAAHLLRVTHRDLGVIYA